MCSVYLYKQGREVDFPINVIQLVTPQKQDKVNNPTNHNIVAINHVKYEAELVVGVTIQAFLFLNQACAEGRACLVS